MDHTHDRKFLIYKSTFKLRPASVWLMITVRNENRVVTHESDDFRVRSCFCRWRLRFQPVVTRDLKLIAAI